MQKVYIYQSKFDKYFLNGKESLHKNLLHH
jgi:hypothetical protein